jgi:hypothetical protein
MSTQLLALLLQALIDPHSREGLIEALQTAQRQQADAAMMRGVLADNRGDFVKFAPVETNRVALEGAVPVVTGNDGPKHTPMDAPSIDAWRPPGLAIMDRMMDQQDALDRAARIQELARLKRGGQ